MLPELSEDSEQPQDSETAKMRLLEALARSLESQTEELVFDDLQWADEASLELLLFLVERTQLKFLISLRPHEGNSALTQTLASLRTRKDYAELELLALSQTEVGQLISSLNPSKQEAKDFSNWLFSKTGGNPFFILETLRALFEAQVLSANASSWYSSLDSLTQAYNELELPPGLKVVIEHPLKGLSNEAKRVLDISAVLAEGLEPELIAGLAGLSIWAASDTLLALELCGLISKNRFSHDLIRQALYNNLSPGKRKMIHKLVAQALEGAELIQAEHYYLGAEPHKAAQIWFQVARFRFGAGHFEEQSTALYERILSLGISGPDVDRAKAYLAGRYLSQNRLEEMNGLIDSVLATSQDSLARTFALLQKTSRHFLKGEMGKARESLSLAERHLADFDDKGLARDFALSRVYLDQYEGKYQEALERSEAILAQKRLEAADFGLISWLSTLAYVHCGLGQFEQALSIYYEQLEVAKQLGFKRSQAQAASDIMQPFMI